MSGYSAFGPRGASTSYQGESSGLGDYDFLPPQEEEEGEELVERDRGGHVIAERRTEQRQQSKQPRQKSQAAEGHTEEERARIAAVEILPMILANPPSIPAAMKSSELNQRHTLLRISPHDHDDYLVTAGPATQPDTSTRVINALEELKGHVEELAGAYSTSQGALDSIIQFVQWQSPEEGILLASVGLSCGSTRTDPLAIILKREDIDDEVAWRFHNLLPLAAAPGQWYSSLDAALESKPMTAPTERRQEQGISGSLSLRQGETEQGQSPSPGAILGSISKTAAVSAAVAGSSSCQSITTATTDEAGDEEGKDKKMQYLYTNAEDFWGGWEGDEERPDGSDVTVEADCAPADEAKEEDDYWDSYGTSGVPEDDEQESGGGDPLDSRDLGATGIARPAVPASVDAVKPSSHPTTDSSIIEHPPFVRASHQPPHERHARTLMRSLVGLVQEGPEPVGEEEFLRWAREAFREDQLEREKATRAIGGKG
ncbi:hypothetical protein BCV69DRAFT_283114 [Microstroma glucosiphilum]|uniref:Uncharacterized protein n=1 Tax=Pseudomicrostroma glucosiphilum TaxID=1684307 RepID=A0A316U4Q7_9BASI|nr:hypothetical protein BCV69DRAFT_283114 [Pseudomicrostroma glucosiphilum]PWN20236.1 hypothetical protein BCV69DRAFT_283114 [Pseudomicrostroma glucosiphilum]